MKLASLKNNDDGFIELFKRLISLAKEIVVFDPDINPAKAETDVFFYFPCENPRHTDWLLRMGCYYSDGENYVLRH